ncbi:MAG: hypothetical protein AUK47_08260 [Deltaproteobacteria bacterium CG2_30_63_29]|nr:MAG: hypothetical protein AUK47_08260 [Deltaproteobacteria bacterium CG2_30_63_29]
MLQSVSRVSVLLIVVAGLCTAAWAFADDEKAVDDEKKFELIYTGEMIDQEGQPVSGIFPLVFKIFDSEKGKTSEWTETQFVSIVAGQYTVSLGRVSPLPERAASEKVFLGVQLDGGELVRQPLSATPMTTASQHVSSPSVGGVGEVEFAAHAGDADTLGGLGPESFAPADTAAQLEAHVNNTKLHGGGTAAAAPAVAGGAALGGRTWKSGYAGGSGGKPFNLTCPEGYVLTGIEGRSGAVMDSIRAVCTQLE